jgi:hypothetical protein
VVSNPFIDERRIATISAIFVLISEDPNFTKITPKKDAKIIVRVPISRTVRARSIVRQRSLWLSIVSAPDRCCTDGAFWLCPDARKLLSNRSSSALFGSETDV